MYDGWRYDRLLLIPVCGLQSVERAANLEKVILGQPGPSGSVVTAMLCRCLTARRRASLGSPCSRSSFWASSCFSRASRRLTDGYGGKKLLPARETVRQPPRFLACGRDVEEQTAAVRVLLDLAVGRDMPYEGVGQLHPSTSSVVFLVRLN